MANNNRLPESFLRGLEADLRALCSDARRKNPQVKEAAERVILALKQANSEALVMNAADNAASAFCAACEPPNPASTTTSLSSQIKVVLKAVSSLHKLLTHRALSASRLPEVLDALQRLAGSCIDDTVTLKVLQGLLSLLTVRSYAKALSEDDLSRAFSLLFILRTSRSSTANNPATNALSAISQLSAAPESGVIEQTSKAAFRQVSSDLFAAAADAALRAAVETQTSSGEFIPLEELPTETRAAYQFFMDLCNATVGKPLAWLRQNKISSQAPTELDLKLALEVMDDGLSGNVTLFAAQPVFSEMLSNHLCPVIHKLLNTSLDKLSTKSLFALIVTVVRHYWRNLRDDSEQLLQVLLSKCKPSQLNEPESSSWSITYAMEALRCIFRLQVGDGNGNGVVGFARSFELSEGSKHSVGAIIKVASETMSIATERAVRAIPPAPVSGAMKPFAKTISNSLEFLVAAAIGVYVDIVKTAEEAVLHEATDVARAILCAEETTTAVAFLGRVIELDAFAASTNSPRSADVEGVTPIDALARALSSVAVTANTCALNDVRDDALGVLARVCSSTVRGQAMNSDVSAGVAGRVASLYGVLFDVVQTCQESLGRGWSGVIDSFEVLDTLIARTEAAGEQKMPKMLPVAAMLKTRLSAVFSATGKLKWTACHDMISALVQCSRQSMAKMPKRSTAEELSKSEAECQVRVFGIIAAETAIVSAFQRATVSSDPMPSTLWEILTGHLTSVCSDSSLYTLRVFALSSLTRIACGSFPNADAPVVPHEKIITPFLDLFNSKYGDVRSGSLSSLYTILESQGERLNGEAAWRAVLNILMTAAGSKAFARVTDSSTTTQEAGSRAALQRNANGNTQGGEMISEGFKVVQVIADDFLASLAKNSLPAWLDVLRLYSRQDDDINVALTSIGLLWRTADFVAKSSDVAAEDWLWVEIFHILKEISVDERPEIRNCAVKTLTGALSAHSFRLSARAWSGCAERALLPLLEEVMKGGIHGEDNVGAAARGRSDAQVMWHHSRDTPRKQWNETRVLALGGVAKVLRSAMPRLSVLQDESGRPLFLMLTDGGANALWRKMLRAAGVAAASRDREVAVAGASALLELLSAAGFVVGERKEEVKDSTNFVPSSSAPASLGIGIGGEKAGALSWMSDMVRSGAESGADEDMAGERASQDDHSASTKEQGTVMLWEAVWSALVEAISGGGTGGGDDKIGDSRFGDTKIVDDKALQMLAEGLIESRNKLSDKFTPESSKMLVQVLIHLAVGIEAADNAEETQDDGGELSEVQRVTLNGLKELSFGEDISSYTDLSQGLLRILPEQSGLSKRNVMFTRQVLEIVRSIFEKDHVPQGVKSTQMKNVIPSLGRIMMGRKKLGSGRSRHGGQRGKREIGEGEAETLWKVACEVLVATMKHGWQRGSGRKYDEEWNRFADLADEFLYGEVWTGGEFERVGRDRAERMEREMFDVKMIECVCDGLEEMTGETRFATKQKLGRLVVRGAEEGEVGRRRRFVRTCQRKLFLLGGRSVDGGAWRGAERDGDGDVGGSGSGGSAERGSSEGNIFEECGQYVVEVCGRVLGQFIADRQRAGRCPLPASRRAEAVFLLGELRRRVSHKQLVALYPRLCECVESRDEAVRGLARELLDETWPRGGGRGAAGGGRTAAAMDVTGLQAGVPASAGG